MDAVTTGPNTGASTDPGCPNGCLFDIVDDETETAALSQLEFGAASTVLATDKYATVPITLPSLNAGLWASANITKAEVPFNVRESTRTQAGCPSFAETIRVFFESTIGSHGNFGMTRDFF